jgi:N-methylhydantoinase A
LDVKRARRAVSEIARELGMGLDETALGIRQVANAEMMRVLRLISVERGHDLRQFVLVAFGGAGPIHGADLAADLGIRRVLVPDGCGVFSALGTIGGDQKRDWVKTV